MPGTGNMLGLRGKSDFDRPIRREGQSRQQQQQRLGDGYGDLNGGMGNANGKIREVEVGGAQEMGMGRGIRAREVSGKRVEEGRGGVMGGGWGMAR